MQAVITTASEYPLPFGTAATGCVTVTGWTFHFPDDDGEPCGSPAPCPRPLPTMSGAACTVNETQ